MSSLTTTLSSRDAGAPRRFGVGLTAEASTFLLALAAAIGWCATAAVTYYLPDVVEFGRGPEFAAASAALGAALLLGAAAGFFRPALRVQVRRLLPWSIALALFALVWQLLAGKLGVLPQPFFPPPHAILEVFTDDYQKLVEGVIASLRLELFGFAIGAIAGFAVGVALGWSRTFGYWMHPVMRLLGPVPSIAWLPIAFFAFPSSFSASIFLIALTTGFPVAVLTWSGVSSVNPAYYDVARTLGANNRFLIFKVAIPAALPHVFVGLFMGLGASFAVLVTAEMMGVKAGLGFYLQWAQSWAAYANMYAALLVMALMCTGLVTLLFKVRDRVLSYQKGDVKW